MLVGASSGAAVYALSRKDGSVQATYPASESVESMPMVQGEHVYFSDTAGDTFCYTLEGELVWKHDGRNPILVQPQLHGSVLYTTDVEDLAIALDKDSGALLWRYEHRKDPTRRSQLALYAAPQAVVLGSANVMFGFSDGSVVSLNAETGDTNWTKRLGEGAYPDIVSTPVAYADDVFVSGYYGPLVAMSQADQSIRWRVDVGAAATPELDVERSVIFHPGSDGVLRSVSALTGDVLWMWDSETGGALTKPVASEAGLFVGMAEGGLALIDPDTGEQLWRFVGDFVLQGVTATPAIDGRQLILVTNAGYIYSFVRP
jgi:outer membrane protein assembly factor BamB